MAQKDSFTPITEGTQFKTSPTPSGGTQIEPQPFREAHPAITGVLDTIAPIVANIGLASTGIGPVASAFGMAGAEATAKYISGETDAPQSLEDAIIQTAIKGTQYYALGKVGETLPRGFQAFRRLQGKGGVPQTFLDLKPTYAQLSGSPFAEALEDIFARDSKAAAVQQSVKIARQKAEELASRMAGRQQGNVLAPGATSSIKTPALDFGDIQTLAGRLERKTTEDYAKFMTASSLESTEVKAIANSGMNRIQVPVQGPQTGISPTGRPLYATTNMTIDGPIDVQNTIHKVLQLKKDIAGTTKTPDPNNPLIRDLDNFLARIGFTQNPKTGQVSYRPLSFEEAWNSKVDYGKAGWEGVTETGKEIKDIRYRFLHDALSKDIEESIPQWQTQPQEAINHYLQANKYVRARHELFEPTASRIVNLNQQSKPDDLINAIVNDNVKLKKFLISNEYKLPNGQVISGTNKRGDMKAYKFMSMFDAAWKGTDPQMATAGDLNSDKLIADWNKFKVSKEGKTLYNQEDVKNIDEFFGNIKKVNTDPGSAGASRYLYLRMGTGMFHLGTVAAAGVLAGGGGVSTAGTVGTIAVTGLALSARQIGKLLTNKEYAPIVNKLVSGQPLGKSWQSAMQVLAYGLKNEKIRTLFSDGSEGDVVLDSKGKPKSQIDSQPTDKTYDLDSFQPSR